MTNIKSVLVCFAIGAALPVTTAFAATAMFQVQQASGSADTRLNAVAFARYRALAQCSYNVARYLSTECERSENGMYHCVVTFECGR